MAVVTGTNRGIGRQVAKDLAVAGWRVFAAARTWKKAEETVAGLEGEGAPAGRLQALALEAADDASIRAAADAVGQAADRVDALVNNAGIYLDEGDEANVLRVSRERMVATFQTNTFGALAVTQAFLPLLRKARGARIVNVSSGYGELEGMSPDVPAYCLSKLALNGLTIQLAEKLQPEGIAVFSVCPGWVRTDMGGPGATRSVEQGADSIVWLAREGTLAGTGKVFRDRQQTSFV